MVRKSGTECLRGKIQQEGWKAWTLELGADLAPLASSPSYSTTISTTKKRKKKKGGRGSGLKGSCGCNGGGVAAA